MSGEHTPDTEEVAFCYEGPDFNAGERRAAFDRWLAAEVAAAERRGAIRAMREAAEELEGMGVEPWNRLTPAIRALRFRADREDST